jgi:hypothetical protein
MIAGAIGGGLLCAVFVTAIIVSGASLWWILLAVPASALAALRVAQSWYDPSRLPAPRARWDEIAAQVEQRRCARKSRVRDLSLLGAASEVERAAWYDATRQRARCTATIALLISFPLGTVASYELWEAEFIPRALLVLATVIVAVAIIGTVAARFRAQRKDPLLLVGRVTDGVIFTVDRQNPTKPQGLADIALEWLGYGFWNTIALEIKAACRLRRDGSLNSEPEWRGRHVVGVRRAAHRHLIESEHTVLLCAGDGSVLYQLHDVA